MVCELTMVIDFLLMSMVTLALVVYIFQPPPSPWMQQRPPLSVDVNVGQYIGEGHILFNSAMNIKTHKSVK